MREKRTHQRKIIYESFQGNSCEDLVEELAEWIADEHIRICLDRNNKNYDTVFFEIERDTVFSAAYMKLMDIIECPEMYKKFYGVSFWNPGDPNLIKITRRSGFYRSLLYKKPNFSTLKKVCFDRNVEYWLNLKNMSLIKMLSQ